MEGEIQAPELIIRSQDMERSRRFKINMADDDDGHEIPAPGYSPAEVLTQTNQPDFPSTGEGSIG